ncbi:MAG: type I phosphomannose isomerase catalytic subunit [Clostridia bacterium]|nr:type I phosphomannose isomerase catalytic subunit [Clostridia bacterium]
MSTLYPLAFKPEFKQRLWGGRRLAHYFPHMPAGPIGEAWILSAHPHGPTVVENGPLSGRTIPELQVEFGQGLVGSAAISRSAQDALEFPLLVKLLDSREDLSVQVHPPSRYDGLRPGESGKEEMWLVLRADPGARIVYGLRPGITRQQLETASRAGAGDIMTCLRQVEVSPGDVIPIPPGVVHSLGAGVVVAEVQQNSDTVYRLWDYGRLGPDGRPRELHVEQALDVIDCGATPATTRPDPPGPGTVQLLSSFSGIDVWRSTCSGPWTRSASRATFRSIVVISGIGDLSWGTNESGRQRLGLSAGSSILIPADCPDYAVSGDLTLLETSMAHEDAPARMSLPHR